MGETQHVVTQQREAWVVKEGLLEEAALKLTEELEGLGWVEVGGRVSLAERLSKGPRQNGARRMQVALHRPQVGRMAMDVTVQPEGLLPPGAPILVVPIPTNSCPGLSGFSSERSGPTSSFTDEEIECQGGAGLVSGLQWTKRLRLQARV